MSIDTFDIIGFMKFIINRTLNKRNWNASQVEMIWQRILLMCEGTLKLVIKIKKSLDLKNRYDARSSSGGSFLPIYHITCSGGGRGTQYLQNK